VKKLFVNIAIICIILLLPLFAIDRIVNIGLRKPGVSDNSFNEIYHGGLNNDVLIMGPSRALKQFSPAILDSYLNTSCYNIGIDGWPFHLEEAMFKTYSLHNRKPKYIIQSIGWGIMNIRHDFFGYENFLPYVNDTIVHEYTKDLDGAFTWSERYFPLFRYNNHFDLIKAGILSYFGKNKYQSKSYKGFIPIRDGWNGKFEEVKRTEPSSFLFMKNDSTIRELDNFLTYCDDSGIKVIFVYAPTYYDATQLMTNSTDMHNLFSSLAGKHNIPILDYANDSICYSKEFFFDSNHLNDKGASKFSRHLAEDLKKYINSSK